MGNPKLYIREYRPGDSDALAALFSHTIRTINLGDYTQDQVEAWAPADRDLKAWAKRFEGRHAYELDPTGYLDRFYVSADFVGQGVGKELYRELERKALCLGVRRIHLEASLTARPFFERCGFQVVKEQTVHPRGVAMNNFLMEKELPLRELVSRKSARILLFSPEQEILLVKIVNPSGGWEGWITPGGGIEPGESEEDGLRRELWEELRFLVNGSERKVWTRKHRFPWGDKIFEQAEVYFLRLCPKFEPGEGSEVVKRDMPDFREIRWWKVKDILSSDENFAPRRLGEFLLKLEAGLPQDPIDVGI